MSMKAMVAILSTLVSVFSFTGYAQALRSLLLHKAITSQQTCQLKLTYAVDGEESDEKPPLRKLRIAGEILTGYGGQIVGSIQA